MAATNTLPVPISDQPHWRVRFRPSIYQEDLIPSLTDCLQLIDQTKLSIRGWDYPHLSNRNSERQLGTNWIASWSDFSGHEEYWRFYQSGQFLHLFRVRETAPDWSEKLRATAKGQLGWGNLANHNWNEVPGFISVLNFLYTVTEIFEFAARLCEKGVYHDQLSVSVEIKGIKGFVLVHDSGRAWMHYYAATVETLGHEWQLATQDLLTQSKEISLDGTKWFFERFGWLNASDQILRKDQENFLMRRF